jgi:hypothetical protein
VTLRAIVASCAIACSALLVLACGVAVIRDAVETRVSVEAAAAGFHAFANARQTHGAAVSLALDARSPLLRGASSPALRRVSPASGATAP